MTNELEITYQNGKFEPILLDGKPIFPKSIDLSMEAGSPPRALIEFDLCTLRIKTDQLVVSNRGDLRLVGQILKLMRELEHGS